MSPRPRTTQQTPLGALLQRARGDLSIAAAAERVGVSHAAWSLWESGKREPSHELLRKICREFRVSATRLGKAILTEPATTCPECGGELSGWRSGVGVQYRECEACGYVERERRANQ